MIDKQTTYNMMGAIRTIHENLTDTITTEELFRNHKTIIIWFEGDGFEGRFEMFPTEDKAIVRLGLVLKGVE